MKVGLLLIPFESLTKLLLISVIARVGFSWLQDQDHCFSNV